MDDMHDNFDMQSREESTREDQARLQKDSLWPYIGDWQTLQDGTVYKRLLRELLEQEIRPRVGQDLPLEDPLTRYKSIPLHARFLYTSMDPLVEYSILEHYAALEGLSRNRCDIYLSIAQFNNPAETLDYLEYSPILKQSGVQIAYDDLPGIFFWNRQWEGEYISFRSHMSDSGINAILLRVFQEIREEPTIAAVRRIKRSLA